MVGLLGLLAACVGREGTGPFRKVDGVWHYKETVRRDVDAATFTPLDNHYAKDATRVYHAASTRDAAEYFLVRHDGLRVFEGAVPARFRLLGQRCATDGTRVYADGAAITGDPPPRRRRPAYLRGLRRADRRRRRRAARARRRARVS